MRDRAALEHANHLMGKGAGDPDAAFGIEADPVGIAGRRLGPDSPIGERAVGRDVECRQALGEGLADDHRPAVGRDDRAVGEHQLVGCRMDGAVRVDAGQHGGARLLAGMAIEAEIADIGAALRVDHHVVAEPCREGAEFRLDRELAVGKAHQPSVGHAHDQHRAVGPPAQPGRPARHLDDRLGLAGFVDGADLVDVEVREIEPVVPPARALAEGKAVEQRFELHVRSHSIRKELPSGLT